ncbi:MAG: hypothetical protein LBS37_03255, partial [Treponema sp.]|nr:hypothetical protein [Treponema sp.]
KEAELIGLAIIGSTALGEYSSFAEAASALARIEGRFFPNKKNAALYDRLFREYRETYTALRRR